MPNYVKNTTWADGSGGGTAITAAKLNNIESGIFDAHYQAAASVYMSSNQSINNTTTTTLNWNNERFDTESNAASTIHDNASNNSRLTCRTAGKYLITLNVDFAPNATGVRAIWIQLNGGSSIAGQTGPGNATYNTFSASLLWDMAVNDYVEALVYQSSGGALNVQTGGASSTTGYSMVRVA